MVRVFVALIAVIVIGAAGGLIILAAAGSVAHGDALYDAGGAAGSTEGAMTAGSEDPAGKIASLDTGSPGDSAQLASTGEQSSLASLATSKDSAGHGEEGQPSLSALGQAAKSTLASPSSPQVLELSTAALDQDTGNGDEVCVGADPHPMGQWLAQTYEVAYEEVMDWFCTGSYGFGEIKHALEGAEEAGMAPEELLALKTELGGWGQVWLELGMIGKKGRGPQDGGVEPSDQDGSGFPGKGKDKAKGEPAWQSEAREDLPPGQQAKDKPFKKKP